jgi:RNA polymerase sigma-70 factor (ECF subfamily)
MTSHDLASLYDAHASAVFGFLLVLTGSEAEAKDLLQEVFLRLARSGIGLHSIGEPRAFLLTVSRRAHIDAQRRRGARARSHAQASAALPQLFEDAAPDAGLCREAMEEALAALPPEQREAVMLHVWGGLTFREMAVALDVPLHTAASRCRYGLTKLRASLQTLYDEIR